MTRFNDMYGYCEQCPALGDYLFIPSTDHRSGDCMNLNAVGYQSLGELS